MGFFWGLNFFYKKKNAKLQNRIRDLYQGQSSSRLAFYSLGIFFRETPILLAKDLGKQKTQGDVEKKTKKNCKAFWGKKNAHTIATPSQPYPKLLNLQDIHFISILEMVPSTGFQI